MSVAIFEDPIWQMSRGERAAVEGVLSQMRPALAVEIGSAEGACLARIAAFAGEVHSFDLRPPVVAVPSNITLHTGDSHELLPAFLATLAERGSNIDFVMVDGDHSAEGVRRDLEDLLNSPAVGSTVILIHDTTNEHVRSGVDGVHFAAWPKVEHVELDWVPGQLFAEPALRGELWYGLGLVIVNAARLAYRNGSVYEQRFHPAARLLACARDDLETERRGPAGEEVLRQRVEALEYHLDGALRRVVELEQAIAAEREQTLAARRAVDAMKSSFSWRVTASLRTVKRRVGRS